MPFASLGVAALAATLAGLWLPVALPLGLGALAALAGAYVAVNRTLVAPLAEIIGPDGARESDDLLARLRQRLAAAREAERAAGEARTRIEAEAERRIAEAEDIARRRGQAARATLAQAVSKALKALAEGDLSVRLAAPDLAAEFDAAVALYAKTVFALASSAGAIGSRVREMAGDAETLAQTAGAEGGKLKPARESMRAAAEEAARLNEEGLKAGQAAAAFGAALEKALSGIATGLGALDRVGAAKAGLGELLDRIDGFAFQTHLIALNAGVEAARAGEAGRGIAIVAQELRGISQRSTEATRELKTAIAALAQSSEKGSNLLREAAAAAERAKTPTPPAVLRQVAGLPRGVEAALDSVEACVARNAEAGGAVGEAARSLEGLVAKLGALAAHFQLPDGFPAYEAAEPAPAPLALPKPRLRALQKSS